MPIHDWTKVDARIFHHFHVNWIGKIASALNSGLLPKTYYALAEQVVGGMGPDVLTLQSEPGNGRGKSGDESGVATTTKPVVRYVMRVEPEDWQSKLDYAKKQRTLVIRHVSGDRVIAMIELVSSGNKSNQSAFGSLMDKVLHSIRKGIHMSIVDLYPPTSRDPHGIHAAVWMELCGQDFTPPSDKPLTLVSYEADEVKTAYVEPVAVLDTLPSMPLFLRGGTHIMIPLEVTYQQAWNDVPARWREVLEN